MTHHLVSPSPVDLDCLAARGSRPAAALARLQPSLAPESALAEQVYLSDLRRSLAA